MTTRNHNYYVLSSKYCQLTKNIRLGYVMRCVAEMHKTHKDGMWIRPSCLYVPFSIRTIHSILHKLNEFDWIDLEFTRSGIRIIRLDRSVLPETNGSYMSIHSKNWHSGFFTWIVYQILADGDIATVASIRKRSKKFYAWDVSHNTVKKWLNSSSTLIKYDEDTASYFTDITDINYDDMGAHINLLRTTTEDQLKEGILKRRVNKESLDTAEMNATVTTTTER